MWWFAPALYTGFSSMKTRRGIRSRRCRNAVSHGEYRRYKSDMALDHSRSDVSHMDHLDCCYSGFCQRVAVAMIFFLLRYVSHLQAGQVRSSPAVRRCWTGKVWSAMPLQRRRVFLNKVRRDSGAPDFRDHCVRSLILTVLAGPYQHLVS